MQCSAPHLVYSKLTSTASACVFAALQDYFPYSHAALFMPPILFLYLEVSESPICPHNVPVCRTLTVIPMGPLLGTAWHGRQRSPRF
jgi:hypothetical protein